MLMGKQQLLLLSMPNNGSDWLADTLINSQDGVKYSREFFNPATNHEFADKLNEAFGSEYIISYKNIMTCDNNKCLDVFVNTWNKKKYNFTKENYSCAKVSFFKNHFNCFALVRSIKESFPCSRRTEVNYWYLSIYQSIIDNKDILPYLIQSKIDHFISRTKKIEEKVIFAYCIYREIFLSECQKNSVPVLDYKFLMEKNELEICDYLKKINIPLNYDAWAKEVFETRKYNKRDFKTLKCDWVIEDYCSIMV